MILKKGGNMITYDNDSNFHSNNYPKVILLGVGGAGGNTVNAVKEQDIKNIYCVAANTDIQALDSIKADCKIQLGATITRGMGTGANPEIGKVAAEEDMQKIITLVEDADIVFLVGGLGGGTGSGAIPVISRMLQEKQILSIVLVTKPFLFEGARRSLVASNALQKIEEYADTLIVIPNQKLFDTIESSNSISLMDAFSQVNNVIIDCIKAVVDTINNPGHINIDFADIKSTMTRMGRAVIGIGKASGENRAEECILKTISSPLLEQNSLRGARSILLNIHGDDSLTLNEMNIIASHIGKEVHPDAHIIIGSSIAREKTDELQLTLIATCFEDQLKTRTSTRHQQATYNNNNPIVGQNKNNANQFYGYNNVPQGQNSHFNVNQNGQNLTQNNPYGNNAVKNSPYNNNFNENFQSSLYDKKNNPENDLDVPAFFRKNSLHSGDESQK